MGDGEGEKGGGSEVVLFLLKNVLKSKNKENDFGK